MNISNQNKIIIRIGISIVVIVIIYQTYTGLRGTLGCSLSPTFENQERYTPYIHQSIRKAQYEIYSLSRDSVAYLYSYRVPEKYRFYFLEFQTSEQKITLWEQGDYSHVNSSNDGYAINVIGGSPDVNYISKPCPVFIDETIIQVAGDYSFDAILQNQFYRYQGRISKIILYSQSEKQIEIQLNSRYVELIVFQKDDKINIFFVEELDSQTGIHPSCEYFSEEILNISVSNE